MEQREIKQRRRGGGKGEGARGTHMNEWCERGKRGSTESRGCKLKLKVLTTAPSFIP